MHGQGQSVGRVRSRKGRLALIVAAVAGVSLTASCMRQAPVPVQGAATSASAAAPRTFRSVGPVEAEINARIIRFKNELAKDGYSAEARLGLGLALLDQGNPTDGERELSRALELGLEVDRVLPPLGRTWNLLGKSKALIAEHGTRRLASPEPAAQWLVALAVAHANMGDARAARDLATQALAKSPQSPYVAALLTQIDLADGKVKEAQQKLAQGLRDHPNHAELLELLGDMAATIDQDLQKSVAAYSRVLERQPRNLVVHGKLIAAALSAGELELASQKLAILAEIAPGTLPHRHFTARVALARGDVKAALDATTIALTEYPRDLRTLLLMAEIQLRLGALRSAEEALANALTAAPTVARTRHLLAQTFLRSGQPSKAQLILEPLVKRSPPDPVALALSAEAALQSGFPAVASRLFDQAARMDAANPRLKAAAALARVQKGDIEEGLLALQEASRSEPTAHADLALLTARLRLGDLTGAGAAARQIVTKAPNRAMSHWILGQVERRQGRVQDAQGHFERALALDPVYVPAALALAELDLARDQPARARGHLQKILDRYPGHLDATLAMAEVEHRSSGNADRISDLIRATIARHPDSTRAQIALVNHLIRSGAAPAALSAAQSAAGRFPEDLNLLDALGRAQFAAGESAQALTTFRKIVSARPQLTEPLLRMVEVYEARGELDSAIATLDEAIRIAPKQLALRVKLVELASRKGDDVRALRVARDLQARASSDRRGFHLEGLVHAGQARWEPALASFKAAQRLEPTSEGALQMHQALLQLGRTAEAQKLAEDWRSRYPRDSYFTGYLGEVAMLKSDWAAAETLFRSVLEKEPDSPDALNNLAWTLARQSRAEAVQVAQRLVEREPRRASYWDTLASALASQNRWQEALDAQRKALELDASQPVLKLSLARYAIEVGDMALARGRLDELAALGKQFPAQAEVWALRQRLR